MAGQKGRFFEYRRDGLPAASSARPNGCLGRVKLALRWLRSVVPLPLDAVPLPSTAAAPSAPVSVRLITASALIHETPRIGWWTGASPVSATALAMAASHDPPSEAAIPDLLSSAEVEQIFGRSGRTLRRWEQCGHLTPVRVGHGKFYRPEDIRRLVSGQLDETMRPRPGPRAEAVVQCRHPFVTAMRGADLRVGR